MEQTPNDPTPPNDYATRFSRPPAATPPAAARTAAAPPPSAGKPYSFSALFEASLTAPLRPWAVFEEASARPAPGLAAVANVAAFSAAFFALNMVRAAALFPSAVSAQPADRIVAVSAVALLLALAASAAAAALLHVAGLAVGGEGDFARSYQAVSMLALALPLEAAALWYPPAAVLPVLLAAVGAAAALEKLHRAPPLASRAAAAGLAAVVIGGGWVVIQAGQRAIAPYLALQQTLQTAQQTASAAGQTVALPPGGAPAAAGLVAMPAAEAQAPAASSMGLVASPAGSGLEDPSALPKTPAQADRAAAAALSQVAPLMSGNAAALKNLTPEQQQQLQQIGSVVNALQGQLRTGQGMTPQQQAQMMRMIQQVRQSYAPAAAPAPTQGDASSTR